MTTNDIADLSQLLKFTIFFLSVCFILWSPHYFDCHDEESNICQEDDNKRSNESPNKGIMGIQKAAVGEQKRMVHIINVEIQV